MPHLAQHHFSGYILLERHGHLLLSKGYGLADIKANLPNTIRSRWPDAGVDKIMTAVAILKLQDQHKLSLRDKLCRYITACPSAWQPMTIRDLLTNVSGMGSYDPFATGVTLGKTMAACKARSLVLAPGVLPNSGSPWSDCNALVLDAVIERLTAKT